MIFIGIIKYKTFKNKPEFNDRKFLQVITHIILMKEQSPPVEWNICLHELNYERKTCTKTSSLLRFVLSGFKFFTQKEVPIIVWDKHKTKHTLTEITSAD